MSQSNGDSLSKTDRKKEGRHSNGRWKKGHCPNPMGRRKAKINQELEIVKSIQQHSPDIFEFSRATVEMKMNGKTAYMSRHAAVLHKLYEGAMKGSITAQRDFLKAIRENAEILAALRKNYDDMIVYWYHECPKAYGSDFEIPLEAELEMIRLKSLLSEYYPLSYEKP